MVLWVIDSDTEMQMCISELILVDVLGYMILNFLCFFASQLAL